MAELWRPLSLSLLCLGNTWKVLNIWTISHWGKLQDSCKLLMRANTPDSMIRASAVTGNEMTKTFFKLNEMPGELTCNRHEAEFFFNFSFWPTLVNKSVLIQWSGAQLNTETSFACCKLFPFVLCCVKVSDSRQIPQALFCLRLKSGVGMAGMNRTCDYSKINMLQCSYGLLFYNRLMLSECVGAIYNAFNP